MWEGISKEAQMHYIRVLTINNEIGMAIIKWEKKHKLFGQALPIFPLLFFSSMSNELRLKYNAGNRKAIQKHYQEVLKLIDDLLNRDNPAILSAIGTSEQFLRQKQEEYKNLIASRKNTRGGRVKEILRYLRPIIIALYENRVSKQTGRISIILDLFNTFEIPSYIIHHEKVSSYITTDNIPKLSLRLKKYDTKIMKEYKALQYKHL